MYANKVCPKPKPEVSVSTDVNQDLLFALEVIHNLKNDTLIAIFKSSSLIIALWPCNILMGCQDECWPNFDFLLLLDKNFAVQLFEKKLPKIARLVLNFNCECAGHTFAGFPFFAFKENIISHCEFLEQSFIG